MLDTHIFFGFQLSDPFQKQLSLCSDAVLNLFIQDHPDYLQSIEHEGKKYLGKSFGSSIEISALEQAENNIFSLLLRLVPDYPFEKQSLVLLACPSKED